MLAKYTSTPVEGCLEALKSCVRYAAGQTDGCLRIPATTTEGMKAYSDSDWAGQFKIDGDVHSRTGLLITFNKVPIDWASTKQLCIATSSGDAESRALATTVARGLQMQYIAEELELDTPATLQIYADADAAIGFARNTGGNSKMKHIDIREQWVQDIRQQGRICINKIGTRSNPADFFTKLMVNSEFDRTSAGLNGQL